MANREHGEVSFEAEGVTYTFRLGCNEMISIQDALGLPDDLQALGMAFQSLGLRKIRTVFFYGLRGSDETMTEEKAGDLISAIGWSRAAEVLNQGFARAMPADDGKRQKGAGATARPSRGPTSS